MDDALRQAEESTKLNPRSLRLPHSTLTLRESLETLEHAVITLPVFARSLVDRTRLANEDNPLTDPDVRRRMADVLRELSAAVRTYGSLATEFDAPRHDLLESELEHHLAAAHDGQDRLSELLGTDPVANWCCRGRCRLQLPSLPPASLPANAQAWSRALPASWANPGAREAGVQPVISILRGLAASAFGTVTVRTPSESCAMTASALTSPGR